MIAAPAIDPLKVVDALLPPMLRVPPVVVTWPPPASEPRDSLLDLVSKTAPASTVTEDESWITVAADKAKVPALIFVSPV